MAHNTCLTSSLPFLFLQCTLHTATRTISRCELDLPLPSLTPLLASHCISRALPTSPTSSILLSLSALLTQLRLHWLPGNFSTAPSSVLLQNIHICCSSCLKCPLTSQPCFFRVTHIFQVNFLGIFILKYLPCSLMLSGIKLLISFIISFHSSIHYSLPHQKLLLEGRNSVSSDPCYIISSQHRVWTSEVC